MSKLSFKKKMNKSKKIGGMKQGPINYREVKPKVSTRRNTQQTRNIQEGATKRTLKKGQSDLDILGKLPSSRQFPSKPSIVPLGTSLNEFSAVQPPISPLQVIPAKTQSELPKPPGLTQSAKEKAEAIRQNALNPGNLDPDNIAAKQAQEKRIAAEKELLTNPLKRINWTTTSTSTQSISSKAERKDAPDAGKNIEVRIKPSITLPPLPVKPPPPPKSEIPISSKTSIEVNKQSAMEARTSDKQKVNDKLESIIQLLQNKNETPAKEAARTTAKTITGIRRSPTDDSKLIEGLKQIKDNVSISNFRIRKILEVKETSWNKYIKPFNLEKQIEINSLRITRIKELIKELDSIKGTSLNGSQIKELELQESQKLLQELEANNKRLIEINKSKSNSAFMNQANLIEKQLIEATRNTERLEQILNEREEQSKAVLKNAELTMSQIKPLLTPNELSSENSANSAKNSADKAILMMQKALAADKEATEKAASEKAEAEKAAAEKAAVEKAASEKAEAEKALAEKAAVEKAEAEKALAEKAAVEKALAEKAAVEKAAAEKAAIEKAAAEKAEAEKIEAVEKAAAEKAEAEKALAKKAEAEKIEAVEKAAAEKAEAEKALAEKAAAEKAAVEKAASEKAEAEKALAKKAEAEKIEAVEKAAVEKAAIEKAEVEKAEAEKALAEKAAAEKALAEKAAVEKAAIEKAAIEKAEAEKAAAEKAEAEKAAAEKISADKEAVEQAAAEKAEAEKAAADQEAFEKAEAKTKQILQNAQEAINQSKFALNSTSKPIKESEVLPQIVPPNSKKNKRNEETKAALFKKREKFVYQSIPIQKTILFGSEELKPNILSVRGKELARTQELEQLKVDKLARTQELSLIKSELEQLKATLTKEDSTIPKEELASLQREKDRLEGEALNKKLELDALQKETVDVKSQLEELKSQSTANKARIAAEYTLKEQQAKDTHLSEKILLEEKLRLVEEKKKQLTIKKHKEFDLLKLKILYIGLHKIIKEESNSYIKDYINHMIKEYNAYIIKYPEFKELEKKIEISTDDKNFDIITNNLVNTLLVDIKKIIK